LIFHIPGDACKVIFKTKQQKEKSWIMSTTGTALGQVEELKMMNVE